MQEILNKRTETSKTYSLGNNKFRFKGALAPQHYKDNYTDDKEEWKDIDSLKKEE